MARMTKKAKKTRAKRLSKQRRMANALREYLRRTNPAMLKRCKNGAKVQRNPGGTITIIPIKIKKAAR
jgi:hypothetical protein